MPDFARDGYIFNFVDNKPDEWPALVCSQANLLALNNSDLQLDAVRSLRWQGSGQLSFQGDGQISAQGTLSLHTGGAPTEQVRVLTDGKVGIGTNAPSARLHVVGAIQAEGSLRVTADANLDANLNVAGTATLGGNTQVQGNLQVAGRIDAAEVRQNGVGLVSSQWSTIAGGINFGGGRVGIGTTTPSGSLQIAGPQPDLFLVGNTTANEDGLRLHYNETAGTRAGVLDVKGASLRLRGESGPTGNGATERLAIDLTTGHTEIRGGLTIRGTFTFPNTSGGSAVLTNATYDNESSFQPNNVKLSLATTGLFILPLTYEFAIGHVFRGRVINGGTLAFRTLFEKKFSINQNGEGYFAAGKGGYVFDHFVNAVGDTLEQGDVVVLRENQQARYSGTNNNIPIPEVDLTTTVYDTRVCGIVAEVVVEQDLPYVEPELGAIAEPGQDVKVDAMVASPYVHPLHPFAAPASPDLDQRKVGDKQMGKMVTLGTYAHCKVDADIAPIQAGDLLTTSPTAGHAQKVLDRSQATGAIIGKALAALDKGKGKIAVLVMLQ